MPANRPPRYALGKLEFLSLSPIAPQPQQRPVIESRAGVDGVAIFKTGKRGEPFGVVSLANYADLATARRRWSEYQEMPVSEPIPMVWSGAAAAKVQVVVLAVELLELTSIVLGVGGLPPSPSRALLAARWTLISLDPQR